MMFSTVYAVRRTSIWRQAIHRHTIPIMWKESIRFTNLTADPFPDGHFLSMDGFRITDAQNMKSVTGM